MASPNAVFAADDGLHFVAADEHWVLEPFEAKPGRWLAFVPIHQDPAVDPASGLARILGTLSDPIGGSVEILGKRLAEISTRKLQRLRAEVGYVHSFGGLLNNRSIRDNVALPLSVHKRVRPDREGPLVTELLDELQLTSMADKRPYQLSGAARFRTCLARAVSLDPAWLVIEAVREGSAASRAGMEWACLLQRRERYQLALAACLPAENPRFERWFEEQGGDVIRYSRAPRVRPTVRP